VPVKSVKSSTVPVPPFEGFGPHALRFFAELDANNNRDWFHANKARYDHDIHQPMAALVSSLSLALAVHDVPLSGDPKTSMFRLNRDIRFSHDKRPYKTNTSAVLSRDGTKTGQGLLYLQIGPDQSFAALGFYMIEPPKLAAFRQAIVDRPPQWRAVAKQLGKAGLKLSTDGALIRLPRGFDAATVGDLEAVIRLKSFVVGRPIAPAALHDSGLIDSLVDFATAGLPLLEFGWRALAGC
jgi:uncharacterized protein (TIGR02453 family)